MKQLTEGSIRIVLTSFSSGINELLENNNDICNHHRNFQTLLIEDFYLKPSKKTFLCANLKQELANAFAVTVHECYVKLMFKILEFYNIYIYIYIYIYTFFLFCKYFAAISVASAVQVMGYIIVQVNYTKTCSFW